MGERLVASSRQRLLRNYPRSGQKNASPHIHTEIVGIRSRVMRPAGPVLTHRAERRLGEMMVAQKETVGFNKGGWTARAAKSRGVPETPQDLPTLAEAGIDKKLAAQ